MKEMLCLNCHKAWAKLNGGNMTSCGDGSIKTVEVYTCNSCKYSFKIETIDRREKPDPCKEPDIIVDNIINRHERELEELRRRVEKLESRYKLLGGWIECLKRELLK